MSVHDDASVDSNSYDSLLDFNWRDKSSWRKETWRGPLSTRVVLPPTFLILPSLPSSSYSTSSEESAAEDSGVLDSFSPSLSLSKHQAMWDGESNNSSSPPIFSLLSSIKSEGLTSDNLGKHPREHFSRTPPMNQPSLESLNGSPCSPRHATARRRIF